MDTLKYDSPPVLSYLGLLQAVINRMATNSTGCKTWCITIVTGVIAIVANKDRPYYIWIAIIPTILFLFLDSYYLGLERYFRNHYNQFVKKLHSDSAVSGDLFIITAYPNICELLGGTLEAMRSIAVSPFYGLVIILLIVVRELIGN